MIQFHNIYTHMLFVEERVEGREDGQCHGDRLLQQGK